MSDAKGQRAPRSPSAKPSGKLAVQGSSRAPATTWESVGDQPARGLFITGTDTDCGKTAVTLALMAALAAQGARVCGMKPVASGSEPTADGLRNDDALRLQAQMRTRTGDVPAYDLINPYAFAPPIAPHLAAAAVGVEIALGPIRGAYQALAADADWVLVEGVGGWRVPLGPALAASDLPAALGIPVLLVVGLRLGCINHALLTAEAIAARGADLIGWVANTRDPAMAVRDDNIATLRGLLPAPCLGVVPWMAAPDPAVLADHLDLGPLLLSTNAPRR